MRIVIIDSGICVNHKKFTNKLNIVGAINIFKDSSNNIQINEEINDEIGHGTSVASIIMKYIPMAELVIVKLFDERYEPDENVLEFALQYINDNIECDFINISAGITRCSNIQRLEKICNDLVDKGVTIVSAFDNDGAMSYPAAFANVIGVDWSLSCFSPNDYQYVENSPINIRGMGYSQLLPTTNDNYEMQRGASFVAPIITGLLCKAQSEGEIKDSVLNYLKKNSKYIYHGQELIDFQPLKIKKAIVVSISKETSALFEHANMLPFEITQIYDLRYCGNVGKNISGIFRIDNNSNETIKNLKVRSIEHINWEDDFDTVIIGHINMIGKASGEHDIKNKLLSMCQLKNKKVYMFDTLGIDESMFDLIEQKILQIRVPIISPKDVCSNTFGKLYQTATPVLGVFGTSPKQGKFTLQLNLRNALKDAGYFVCNLGTEPESELFGFEATYPFGYNSTVNISGGMAITYINQLIQKIDNKNPDLIIVGSQSQTVQTGGDSLGYMAYRQHELILGTQPDAYILCVNITDEVEYIERTINFLHSVTPAQIIALAIFPMIYKNENGYLTKIIREADDSEMENFANLLEEKFKISAISMNDTLLMDKLQNKIECFFS